MAVLRWLAAVVLVVALIVAVGTVVAYVYGGATLTVLVISSAVAVAAWHALRRLEPRSDPAEVAELPPAESLFVVGLLGTVILLGVWNLLAGTLALFALLLFMRRAA